MHATEDLTEADRLMRICNACRYCEGLCAVFPAMELRRTFADGDLTYLANLCHQCGACYYDCQYAPPHEFAVNVPVALSKVRAASYPAHAWPRPLAHLFERNGLWIMRIAGLASLGFVAGFALAAGPRFVRPETGPGAFYRIMSHDWMAGLLGAAFVFALVAMWQGVAAFWRTTDAAVAAPTNRRAVLRALHDAAHLTYLDGGGVGCMNEDERPTDRRRLWHHLTFYGFVLCFLSTSSATIYAYGFGWQAPYSLASLPVIFGTLGGIGLVLGTAGLFREKLRRDQAMSDTQRWGMDNAFLAMLFLLGLTGLLLLALRTTAVMQPLLAVHLGLVLGFFVTMPYGKFVHGLYRFAALVRHAAERRRLVVAGG